MWSIRERKRLLIEENIREGLVESGTQFPVIEINSDASLAEAIEVLAKNRILSAPVRDVAAPEDASWMDKYIGFAEFSGIVMWLLHQSESTAYGTMADSMTTLISYGSLGRQGSGILPEKTANPRNVEEPVGAPDPEKLDSGSALGGDFFEMLTSSEFYRETKVKDIAGSFRWAPFLALQKSDSFLTMLLLLSKYRIKCLPVVDIGGERIENIITQSSVVHMLAKCIGLPWFKNWGEKSLFDVDLPAMKPEEMVKIEEDEPVLKAFKLMRTRGVSGLPVIKKKSNKPIGNISLRDVQYLFMAPEIFKDFRSVTAKDFLTAVHSDRCKKKDSLPVLEGVITCQMDDTIQNIILKLDEARIQRIYVINSEGDLEGVVTLQDIISKFVQEPPGYFGDFFYGVVPSPRNSSV